MTDYEMQHLLRPYTKTRAIDVQWITKQPSQQEGVIGKKKIRVRDKDKREKQSDVTCKEGLTWSGF